MNIYYILGGLFIWLLVLSFLFIRLFSHYQRMTKGISKKNLISSLNQLISQAKSNSDDIKAVAEDLKKEVEANRGHLQRIGFKRFNPFTNTGGNQSFSLCLLDENGDGIMISSLHSRESTRIYAKPINKGKSAGTSLSAEEKQALKQALSK